MTFRTAALAVVVFAAPTAVARAQTPDPFRAPDVFRSGPGITYPTVIYEATPRYSSEALRAQIRGSAEVEATVLTDGTVGDVRIHKSLDRQFGLDDEALRASKAWRFRPAMKDGTPVKFLVIIQLEFTPDSSVQPGTARFRATADLPQGAGQAQAPVGPGPGVVNPTVLYEAKPVYTQDALRAKIQGVVEVEAVIDEQGLVKEVRVHKSLDRMFGLDEAALAAARGWRFRPATLGGKTVPFRVIIALEFRLQPGDFERGAVREGTAGLVMPTLTREEKPKYTAEAMRRKIQGAVEIQVVVGVDGMVNRARIMKSLDQRYGLDDEALTAALRWRFKPGTIDGKPVSVLITITMEFRID
jgi:TonB family protein